MELVFQVVQLLGSFLFTNYWFTLARLNTL